MDRLENNLKQIPMLSLLGGFFVPKDVYYTTLKSEKLPISEDFLLRLEKGYRRLAHMEEAKHPYRSLGARILATDLHETLFHTEPDAAHMRAIEYLSTKLRKNPEAYDDDPLSELGAAYVGSSEQMAVFVRKCLRETTPEAIDALNRYDETSSSGPATAAAVLSAAVSAAAAASSAPRSANFFDLLSEGHIESTDSEEQSSTYSSYYKKKEEAPEEKEDVENLLANAAASAEEERMRQIESEKEENEKILSWLRDYLFVLYDRSQILLPQEEFIFRDTEKRSETFADQMIKISNSSTKSESASAQKKALGKQLQLKLIEDRNVMLDRDIRREELYRQELKNLQSDILKSWPPPFDPSRFNLYVLSHSIMRNDGKPVRLSKMVDEVFRDNPAILARMIEQSRERQEVYLFQKKTTKTIAETLNQ